MDTSRSVKKVEEFFRQANRYKRKTRVTKKEFKATPSAIFQQLCPSCELDWIDGWDCELIYTRTGYAHKNCIFTTPASNELGKGVWIFTSFEEDKNIELYIVNSSYVEQVNIDLEVVDSDFTLGIWTITYTALNEEGNKIVESKTGTDEELEFAIEGLSYFLENGELLTQEQYNEK